MPGHSVMHVSLWRIAIPLQLVQESIVPEQVAHVEEQLSHSLVLLLGIDVEDGQEATH